jgi:hypothetical protein
MTDTPNAPVPLDVATRPTTVAEALALHARLTTLGDWIEERKRAVRDWTYDLAAKRKDEDGAAPTWRLDLGSIVLTDPQPTPKITDREALGRWYVETVMDADPDADPSTWGPEVTRRTVARASSDALLDFLNGLAEADGHADQVAATASALSTAIITDDEWILPETLLDDLIATGVAKPVGGVVVYFRTGEPIPGVAVTTSTPTIQMRPKPAVKRGLRDDLDRLIGRPMLTEEG